MTVLIHLKCSLPTCNNTVSQHSKTHNKNKQFCNAHRTRRKHEIAKWKMDRGCANKDGHYGFPCVCKLVLDSIQLDINHIDGNNMNRDPANIEVLCKMCHALVTVRNGHHLTPSGTRRLKPIDTGLFDWV